MKTCILSLFILVTVNIFPQVTGWVWQNPLPQGGENKKIIFTSQDTGYQVGYWGTIIKTTNAGINWFNVIENSNYTFGEISFINSNTGIVAGLNYYGPGDCRVLKTTNGGINWRRIAFDSTKNLRSISFGDENTGYGTCFPNIVYKTTNCGETWFATISPGNLPNYTCFINSTTGFFTGNSGYIYKTTDGCISFSTNNIAGKNIGPLRFIDQTTGFAIAAGNNISFILRTTDTGANWVQIDSVPTQIFKNIQFVNSQTGYIMSNHNSLYTRSLYLTTNSGLNWNGIYTSPGSGIESYFTDASKGFLISHDGQTLRTTNAGFNWFDYSTITYNSLSKVQFINENTGFIAGSGGTFLSTTNGGSNWILKPIDTAANYISLYFTDENTGFLSGYKGTLPFLSTVTYKTVDSGNNWSLVNTTGGYSSIFFTNSMTGYRTGPSNVVYKTTNGGTTWSSGINLETSRLYKIFFTNDNTGFVCGAEGKIYKTTDAGLNWINKFGAPLNTITDIFFADQNSGFVIAVDPNWSYNRIFRSTDAGENWTLKYQSYEDMNSIHFPVVGTGYISGLNGLFLKTTNNGENWFTPSRFTGSNLFSTYFTSVNTGYVVGGDGTIMKTTNSGVLIPVNNIQTNILKEYSLSQNYPNPFNPVTNIKFDMPNGGFVKITIYDITGKEITQLVNQRMQAGSYSSDWDASNYPSGVYFYKLETDGFVESKKMVLVK